MSKTQIADVTEPDKIDTYKCSTVDELAKLNGFESEEELVRLASSVDLSTPEKLIAYSVWHRDDGSKAGLLALIKE